MGAAKSLRILNIGNSFTDSLQAFFWQAVESAGCEVLLGQADHGGCELHRHWSYIKNEEADGVYSVYSYCCSPSYSREQSRSKLREILKREPWDIVSIQQASHFSWRPETYQPFAKNIVDFVKTHAPQAEIVMQQTWSYNANDGRLLPGEWKYDDAYLARVRELGVSLEPGPWRIDQDGMYEALTAAYKKAASELGLRLVPSGLAVQLARRAWGRKLEPYPVEIEKSLRWPELPPNIAGDVVGSFWWRKDAQTGELSIAKDTIHLNCRGQYLQACVWFACLYGRKASDISFVPECVSGSDAKLLRSVAQEAVDSFEA